MHKILRSLIHEQFPKELRVKIALLSKRRDIINSEKQEELFKLLREYKIEGITPLGPGTNRYAFKLNGFVIKVATDHDGIIDNLKEFKMAKRLYPHVTKIYEVSENGTLLVAEYIQPFSSYAEMYTHADEIREILRNFSSVYLIGDVGITAKNFANWGLRVGSDSPVCLDFAYVYDVSSELFVCRKCKTNSMLVPDRDFVKLMCPAKGCGAVYEFSDIRRRIGNDLHRQEIGDLTEEGYLMGSSNILTELTPERSNYLEVPKSSKEKEEIEEEENLIEPFILEHPISYYNNEEATKMNLNTNGMNFNGGVVAAEVVEEDVAFSGDMAEATVIQAYIIDDTPEEPVQVPEEIEPVDEPTPVEATPVVVEETPEVVNDEETVAEVAEDHEEKKEEYTEEKAVEPVKVEDSHFSNRFIKNAHFAVSNIGKLCQEYLAKELFFDSIKNTMNQKKMYAGDFYKIISTVVYKAIVGYCNFDQIEIPNKDKPGTHRGYQAPANITGEIYEPTMIFIQRCFIDERLKHFEYMDELMEKYREFYGDYLGLQREIIPSLRLELTKRVKMTEGGVNQVINELDRLMFVPQEVDDVRIIAEAYAEAAEEPDYTLKNKLDEAIKNTPVDEEVDIQKIMADAIHEVIKETKSPILEGIELDDTEEENTEGSSFDEEPDTEPEEEVAFSGDVESTEEDEYQYDGDEDDSQENNYIPTYIKIFKEDDMDIVRLETADAFGEIVIPFHTKLEDIDPNVVMPSMVDDRNQEWDWLTHFVPLVRFYTNDPDKWLAYNDTEIVEDQVHTVILDELDDGRFVMGFYIVDGMYFVDDDGNYDPIIDVDTVKIINNVIMENVSTNDISHLKRTVINKDDIFEEDEVKQFIHEEYDDDDDDEEGDDMAPTDAEQAAIDAMFSDIDETPAPEPTDDESDAEDFKEEDDSNNMIFTPVRRPGK